MIEVTGGGPALKGQQRRLPGWLAASPLGRVTGGFPAGFGE